MLSVTLRRSQTKASHSNGSLRLVVSETRFKSLLIPVDWNYMLSPYFQTKDLRKIGTTRNIQLIPVFMITIFVQSLTPSQNSSTEFDAKVEFTVKDSNDTYSAFNPYMLVALNATDLVPTVTGAIETALAAYASGVGFTIDKIVWLCLPMIQVSGVSKSGAYPVVAAPSVAGGAGVARFYIDSKGDGTGTAPSEVFTASLQAVVVNTTASYLPQSITVDTNRKYIDVKMGQLATGLAGIIPILTGAVANAANGTVVNCMIFVK